MAASQTDYYVLWNTNEGAKYYKARKDRETPKYIYVEYDDGSTSYFNKNIVNEAKNNEGLIKVISSDVWNGANNLMYMMKSPPSTGNQVADQPQDGAGRKRHQKKKSRKRRYKHTGGGNCKCCSCCKSCSCCKNCSCCKKRKSRKKKRKSRRKLKKRIKRRKSRKGGLSKKVRGYKKLLNHSQGKYNEIVTQLKNNNKRLHFNVTHPSF